MDTTTQRVCPMEIEVQDFSPEWDYTTGGSKVLVCIKPGLDTANFDESLVECSFGDCIVPVKFV